MLHRRAQLAGWLTAAAFAVLPGVATAQSTVKIGAIYPLSGNAASAGTSAKAAIEVAVDIINEDRPELGELTLAKGLGLPNLKGAKVEVIFADNQGTPAAGQNQALRLITEDKVVALQGAYQSGITVTASAIAERYGIPFMTGESVAANLTERGFKWFFRTTPVASDIAKIYVDFLNDRKAKGEKIEKVAIVNENTEYGTSIAKVVGEAAKTGGFNVSVVIPYSANTTDVQSQVLQLKDNNPDAVVFISYTSDAILFTKTMQALGYKPRILIGDNSGFSDASYIRTVGNIAQGAINRSAWDVGKPGSPTFLINEMYKKKTGNDLDDTSGRVMQGFLTLVDAINRAGSTEPAKIQAALRATDLKPNQIMMGYKGVKFDDKGQNILASALLIQIQGDKYVSVWPKESATSELQLPYKGW
ncbi:ABC transporter substrate-binding protein [Enterovirga sp.]|jgi:branched-chain amino acid transport system substrate-binding protein|uniref:ABC transporter substrate-binding protein n=1 Tax=Enterovirga sp. TaxID=2026350 RepID=UPI0026037A8B|nr:ABC transporter substrate-binding protein [Enterovirga sp.]MDB5592064.1 Highaffinity leucinespecific transport system periplasmic binding protein LivK [Enterovirga sp.]